MNGQDRDRDRSSPGRAVGGQGCKLGRTEDLGLEVPSHHLASWALRPWLLFCGRWSCCRFGVGSDIVGIPLAVCRVHRGGKAVPGLGGSAGIQLCPGWFTLIQALIPGHF